MPRKSLRWFAVLFTLSLFAAANVLPVAAQKITPPESAAAITSPQADNFGYALNPSAPFNWKDTTTGTLISFASIDDDVSAAIPIGFTFKFFERAYTQIYVNTNGLILFGEPATAFANKEIPKDTLPNDFVAVFWDDLYLIRDDQNQFVSRVRYLNGTDANGNFIVIEWNKVAKLGTQDFLTFQVVLYQNGNVLLQYQTLTGNLTQATVGIEDADGVDGTLVLYNAAGLSAGQAILFTRPAAGARGKLAPAFNSAFTQGGSVRIPFTLVNTAESNTDIYDFSTLILQGATNWQLQILTQNGTPIRDTNANSTLDSGTLPSGQRKNFLLEFTAPANAIPGDFVRVQVQARSAQSNQTASTTIQAAVPAPFAQAFFNGQLGLNTAFIWQHNQITRKPTEQQFTGSNLGITALPNQQYVYTWERNQLLPGAIAITNLEFVHLNRFGFPSTQIYRITDNQAASLETEDRYLSLTPLSENTVAGVWKRTKADTIAGQRKINENVYLSIFDTSGNILLPQVNLTQNDLWRGQSDFNIPYFFLPKIAPSTQTNGRLLLVWAEERLTAQGSQSDIFYALLTQTGQVVKPATKLTNSSPLTNRYNNPAVLPLPNGRFFLAYNLYPLIGESQLAYAVLDETGNLLQAQTNLIGSTQALSPDVEQLSSGEIFMGWHTSPENHIGFVSLNPQTYVPLHSPTLVDTPKNRAPGEVAVTHDTNGHGIITWYEVEQSDYLSYLLADSSGNLVTPPMIYRFGYGDNPNIYSNVYGAGSAVYEGMWQTALPLIRR